jgi:hypothetical protein
VLFHTSAHLTSLGAIDKLHDMPHRCAELSRLAVAQLRTAMRAPRPLTPAASGPVQQRKLQIVKGNCCFPALYVTQIGRAHSRKAGLDVYKLGKRQ